MSKALLFCSIILGLSVFGCSPKIVTAQVIHIGSCDTDGRCSVLLLSSEGDLSTSTLKNPVILETVELGK